MKRIICLVLALVLVFSFTACNSHFTYDVLEEVIAKDMGKSFHTSTTKNYKSVVRSGLYELLYDETNCAVALKDTTDTVWYSLPTAENSIGSLLNIEVTEGSKRFVMNSQDNAVAFGKAKGSINEDGIDIAYTFLDNGEDPRVSFDITLKVRLEDGTLVVSCDTSSVPTKYTIMTLDILPTFGAVSSPKEDDYIVVPDGCGALINLSKVGNASYLLDTYGTDPNEDTDLTNDLEDHPALFAAFGLKSGTNAFAGIVTAADTISKVKATTGDFDRVCASFTYPKDENLEVTYKFISGSAATYGSLASMCREQFVRDGMLSTRLVDDEGNLPVNITLEGSYKTQYENAQDIVSVLKAKGVNALNLKYDGVIKKLKVQSKVGSKDELEELKAYLVSQGFGFYVSVDLDSALSSNNFASKVVSFMKRANDYEFPGYCLGDIGSTLSSTSMSKRQAVANDVFSQAIALSTNKSLMVENGNLYCLKNANVVSNIPLTTSYDTSESYVAVPFVQMVLHGLLEYTGPDLTTVEDYETQLLRCLEYGAMPSYSLTFDEDEDNYYENWDSMILDAYKLFSEPLSTLRSAKMTDHKKIQEGLYQTEYNNETFIYVNYTDKKIDYNGLTIKAKSYLRVN